MSGPTTLVCWRCDVVTLWRCVRWSSDILLVSSCHLMSTVLLTNTKFRLPSRSTEYRALSQGPWDCENQQNNMFEVWGLGEGYLGTWVIPHWFVDNFSLCGFTQTETGPTRGDKWRLGNKSGAPQSSRQPGLPWRHRGWQKMALVRGFSSQKPLVHCRCLCGIGELLLATPWFHTYT